MKQKRRFEVKIPIPLTKLNQLELWLKLHPLAFSEDNPPRFVNSLYLDHYDLSRYEENLSGISERTKVRIRWYQGLTDSVDYTLEFKHRRSGTGIKDNYRFKLSPIPHYLLWREFIAACCEQLPEQALIKWGCQSYPVLICRYRRCYLKTMCGRIRATLDTELVYFSQRYSDQPNLTQCVPAGDYVLLELKTDRDNEHLLSELINSCPGRPSRHSKYANGIRNLMWN